jgi:hypothetical protein
MKIVNKSPYADYVQGVEQQRGHWADKWRKTRDIMWDNMAGMLRAANQAVARWLKDNEPK